MHLINLHQAHQQRAILAGRKPKETTNKEQEECW
jgi:hypothetical protein